jgi:hypothetical protein
MYKYRERRDAVSGQGRGSISNSPAGYRDNKYSYVDKYYLEQKIKKQPASDSAGIAATVRIDGAYTPAVFCVAITLTI